MEQNIEEVKVSYYEYIIKVSDGAKIIADLLRKELFEKAFKSIGDFAEGLEWLVNVEKNLIEQGYSINSRISEVIDFMNEINNAIEEADFVLVADLFEYEIQPVFSSASEWIFQK